MTPSELAHWCVETGFLPQSLEAPACQALAKAYQTKGDEEVEMAIQARARRGSIYSMRVLDLVLSDIKDKPIEEKPKPMSIGEEIEAEKHDFYYHKELNETLGKMYGREPKPFSRPNDPKFDKHPSIFDATPYRDLSLEKQKLYKENTFLSVLDEATKASTSMHEICRRKGLVYEALLV